MRIEAINVHAVEEAMDLRVSDLLCIIDLVHTSPKGSMNDHLEG